jgi:hypothetical protein
MELENAELRGVADWEGGLLRLSRSEEKEFSEMEAPSLSSKLGTVLMVEFMRVGIRCGS